MAGETFEHVVEQWTVGQLRAALEGVPDDAPIAVHVAEEPGGDTADIQIVTYAEVEFPDADDPEFTIQCEFPSGTYNRRR